MEPLQRTADKANTKASNLSFGLPHASFGSLSSPDEPRSAPRRRTSHSTSVLDIPNPAMAMQPSGKEGGGFDLGTEIRARDAHVERTMKMVGIYLVIIVLI
jgi:hypothetical protein